IRRVKPSVVSIIAYDAQNEPVTTGSGFFIRPNQIVTNLHVVESAHHAEVRTFDGKGKTYPVEGLLAVDEEGDLALLGISLPPGRDRALKIAHDVPPEEGENVFVIGNPLRLEGSVSDGIVSAIREVPGIGSIIQMTAPISQGSSGSPLFDMKGQVVGVVTIKVTNGQNINMALAAARVAALRPDGKLLTFDELAARGRVAQQKPEARSDWFYLNGLNSLWLGNYDNALQYFENAVNKNPGRVEAWIQVGYCKVKQGKNSDAIRAYQQALLLKPNSVEAYNKLGDAHYYAGSFHKAIEAYKQAARLAPQTGEAYYNLGLAYLEIGDRAAAVAQSNLLKSLDTVMYQKLLAEIQR
ncbi:MAG: tetratricopeptide repeat-containing serine protease family protein, partial [Acidobacteriota bacterium]|nr:tetratricopeptide repeat-containing serine protease family protein [Acidobacteriota bacterium]